MSLWPQTLIALGLVGCTDLTVLDQADPQLPLPTSEHAHRWSDSQYSGQTELVAERMRLQTTIPAATSACHIELGAEAPACIDADADGLSDIWERIALHRLRPFVRMHPSEPLFRDYHGRVMASGRVTPIGNSRIRVFLPIVFSYDYGRCSATQHRGDPERIALDLLVLDAYTIEVAGVYTASHEGTPVDGSTMTVADELSGLEYANDSITNMPRWVVYSSIGKHAMYPSANACASQGTLICVNDDCAEPGDSRNDLLPDVYNVGEPDSLHFEFEGCNEEAPHSPTRKAPARTDIWGTDNYCGGIPNDQESYSASCSGPIRTKLTNDPFDR